MTMAAAASKQGIILGCLSTAHLLPRPKEWKETITLKKKTEKGQKRKQEKRGKLSPDFFGKTAFHLGTILKIFKVFIGFYTIHPDGPYLAPLLALVFFVGFYGF